MSAEWVKTVEMIAVEVDFLHFFFITTKKIHVDVINRGCCASIM